MGIFSLLKTTNTAIFLLLAILHLYWAFGGLFGAKVRFASGVVPEVDGKPVFRPGFGATLAVAVGLLAFAFVSAWAIRSIYKGVSPVVASPWWCIYGNLAISIIFLLRAVGDFKYVGLFKTVKNSVFARNDTQFYTPLCLVVSVIAFCIYWLAKR